MTTTTTTTASRETNLVVGIPSSLSSSSSRRVVLSSLLGVVTSLAVTSSIGAAHAGELGSKITQAVTQSELGVSVRTSVIQGAQIMDRIDGQWERFSDRFRLGTQRSKLENRPIPRVIPEPLPLDPMVALAILKLADDVFLSLVQPMVQPQTLQSQIRTVAQLVRPAFVRSNVELSRGTVSSSSSNNNDLDENDLLRNITTAAQFNFASYVHFKAYSDLILQQGKAFDFNAFRRAFEAQMGQGLVALLLMPQLSQANLISKHPKSEQVLNAKLEQIDQLCRQLQNKGLVSLAERSILEQDQILDWMEDLGRLSFTVALDGDITLGSQLLLQEQGFRLYPDYARFAVLSLLQNIEGQEPQIEDYYFDTQYNPDPDKFEANEVVLNIVLDSV